MPLDPLDFLELDGGLSDAAIATRDSARAWIQSEFMPQVTHLWRVGTLPREFFPALGALGAFGTTLTDPGCPGRDALTAGVLMRELERGDSGLRTCASVQGSLAMTAVSEYGSDEQKSRLLPDMAAGRHLACFGLTESGYGSNPGGLQTRAHRDGDDYVLNGEKMWIGNATVADTAVIWAKADDIPQTPADSSKAIRGFLVDTGLKGYTANLIEGRLSLRVGLTANIELNDVRVPASAALPGAIGLRAALTCLDSARYGIVWGSIGAAMACLEEALGWADQRQIFDRPLASFQLTQDKLARMLIDIAQAQAVAWQLATLKQAGRLQSEQISLAKAGNVEAARRVARIGRDILGAVGICDDHACMRHLCNLESVATYEGTRDIHHLVLGQAMTGHAAFR